MAAQIANSVGDETTAALISIGNTLFQVVSAALQGCGQTCVAATQVVNQLEPLLTQNVAAYLSAPVHYASLQQQALANFDSTWSRVMTACSNPALADAGRRCITDRQAGACQYKTSPGGWSNGVYTAAGPNGSGSTCWNWFVGYRDPIAHDPTVVPDPAGVTAEGGGLITNTASNYLPLLLAGGLLLVSVMIGGQEKR